MTNAQRQERQDAIDKLRQWYKPGDTVYTILEHVSRSGMSRQIRVVIPYTRDDGQIDHLHPNYLVAKALGWRQAKRGDGVIVGGAGMDAGYHLAYTLSHILYPDGFGCIGDRCPSTDHRNGDRDYTPHGAIEHWHRDGVSALRHRWI